MRVLIETIPHGDQRYETCGDWWVEEIKPSVGRKQRELYIRVSEMGDWRKEMLVAHHELTEALLCLRDGVNPTDVDAFDIEFEAARKFEYGRVEEDLNGDTRSWPSFAFRGKPQALDAEPGDHPDAPYYRQHQIATGVERILATLLGVGWTDYEASCAGLSQ